MSPLPRASAINSVSIQCLEASPSGTAISASMWLMKFELAQLALVEIETIESGRQLTQNTNFAHHRHGPDHILLLLRGG
jgi:hypothetical protein